MVDIKKLEEKALKILEKKHDIYFFSDLCVELGYARQYLYDQGFSPDKNDTLKQALENNKKIINKLELSKVIEARVKEILKLSLDEIKNLTNREIRYIIVTGGLTELSGFSELVEQEFGFVAKVLTMTTLGIRHNQYSSSYGIIKYFDDKLELRGKHYNMISKDDGESLLTMDSSISKENMLNKVFGDILKP